MEKERRGKARIETHGGAGVRGITEGVGVEDTYYKLLLYN